VRQLVAEPLNHVGVYVQRDGDRRMTQGVRYDLWMDAILQRDRRECVPGVLDGMAPDTGSRACSGKGSTDTRLIQCPSILSSKYQVCILPQWTGPQPHLVLPYLVFPKCIQRCRAECYRPVL
jgi:hypothetical protein